MQSTCRIEYNAAVWHEARSHTFVRNVKKNVLCLIAKLQRTVLAVLTFKQLHHIPDKLVHLPGEPDYPGGLQNVLMGQ